MECSIQEIETGIIEAIKELRNNNYNGDMVIHISSDDFHKIKNFCNPYDVTTEQGYRYCGYEIVSELLLEPGTLYITRKSKTEMQNTFKDICHELMTTYSMKNSDYGDSFGKTFEEYGIVSAVVRIADKYNRISQLAKSERKVDESIEDTLLDLAGYCIMTVMELRKSNT